MKHTLKRLTALVLALSLCLSMLSATAWAAETETVGEAVAEITAEESDTELVLEDTAEEADGETTPSEGANAEAEEATEEVSVEEAPAEDAADEEVSDETGSEETISDAAESAEEAISDDPVETDVEEAETVSATTASGTCGDDLTWTLSSAGKLTISGTGEMTSWSSYHDVPWYDYQSSITSVYIGSGVTSIGSYAFMYCTSLTAVTIPSGVTSVGTCAFCDCTGLTSVTFPSSVTSIGTRAFQYCISLSSVTIPSGVTSVGDYAFFWCNNLTSVAVSSSVTSIGTDAFGYATYSSLMSNFTLYGYSGSAAETYASENGVTFVTLPLSAPSVSVSNVSAGVKISWSKITGATDYQIYVSTSSDFSGETRATTTTGVSRTITGLTSGTTYSVKVRSYVTVGGTRYYSSWSSAKSIKYLTAGKISNLTNTANGITVKWSKVTGASGYYVYRKTSGGSYSKIKKITGGSTVSYTDTAVKNKNGVTYTYAVRPYYGSTTGFYTGKKTVRMTAVSLSSVKNSASKAITIKWAKNAKATGYQIYISTSSTFSSGTKSATVTGTSRKITGLTKGKTYYVKIRAYKTVSGTKYYSAWSASKKVKIAK